ncbi:MAG: hypothetical protein LAT65_05880 [Saccharospirillum sp.]|nr:hypothetical protein [Saccharospirillum sp.]
MTKGTEITNTVIETLKLIHTDQGFKNTVTTVLRGRPDRLQPKDGPLPAIMVSTTQNPVTNQATRSVKREREINIVGVVDATTRDYEPALDELDEDIVRALLPLLAKGPYEGAQWSSVQISGGEYTHPEGGSTVAAVAYTLTVGYTQTIANQEG